MLNEILADPNIVKVIYHVKPTVEHLQREVGLYLVNVLDLNAAERLVETEKSCKQFTQLLKTYCNEELGPAENWIARPLTPSLIKHGRQRVHYLLHIQDKIQNKMVAKGSAQEIYDACTKIISTVWYPGKILVSKFLDPALLL